MKNSNSRQLSAAKLRLAGTLILSNSSSNRLVSKQVGIAESSVRKIRQRLAELGMTDSAELNSLPEQELLSRFYPSQNEVRARIGSVSKYIPDYDALARRVEDKRLTAEVLYEEYADEAKQRGLEVFSKSYFKTRLRKRFKELCGVTPDVYLAQEHEYGRCMELDFSGDRYKLLTHNGPVSCWLMVICWPASYYVYAEFVTAQSTSESCRVIGNAIRYVGMRAPMIAVVDNAKCFVQKHSGSEAIINKHFSEFMLNMGICIDAAPPYHPQFKSSVEHSVERAQLLASSLKYKFETTKATVAEHSRLLMTQVQEVINQGPFRGSKEKTRDFLFRNYELPACMSVPAIPEYREDIRELTVPRSYHIEIEQHRYSVPSDLVGKTVEVLVNNDTVIIRHEGKEVARHLRSDGEGKTTQIPHMPGEHQAIVNNANMYSSTDDVLRISKDIDPGVYRFCASRIKHDEERRAIGKNTIRCCVAVINAYKRCPQKSLFSEACISTLAQPSELWNSYKVKENYEQVMREFLSQGRVQHQSEIFRSDGSDAYLREQTSEQDTAQKTDGDDGEAQDYWFASNP